jgi:magnesium chelatase subunit D
MSSTRAGLNDQLHDRAMVQWQRALLAADLLACDPKQLRGVCIRAAAGSVRDAWVTYFLAQLGTRISRAPQLHRLPLNASDDRLLGGLDLVATLASGHPVPEAGLLARANGGVLVVAMAERMSASTSARLCAVLDTGHVKFARDGLQGQHETSFVVIAFDEGYTDDERPPSSLLDRLAFRVDLREIPARTVIDPLSLSDELVTRADQSTLPKTAAIDDEQVAALCGVALAFGIPSLRAAQLAVAAAKTSARVFGRTRVTEDDVTLAAELVLAAQAKSLPQTDSQTDDMDEQADDNEPDQRGNDDQQDDHNTLPPQQNPPADEVSSERPKVERDAMPDRVIDAVQAAIPAALLAQLQAATAPVAHGQRSGGSAGRQLISNLRGRPLASRRGDPRSGARLDVLATIRAAAPWQALRRAERARAGLAASGDSLPILIRRDDWHVSRRAHRSETLTLLAVDASGSAALHRLAEAKGAAELLLAECYVRRDQVAVVSFRGKTAETLLPPTRSLVRAKRSLAGLPGGGGTPLAAGIDMAYAVADAAQWRGMSPTLVFLTDGRANVSRDGTPGRVQAALDALMAAKRLRSGGFNVLMIDTSPEPQDGAKALADAMRARYLALPYAAAPVISAAVQSQTRARS